MRRPHQGSNQHAYKSVRDLGPKGVTSANKVQKTGRQAGHMAQRGVACLGPSIDCPFSRRILQERKNARRVRPLLASRSYMKHYGLVKKLGQQREAGFGWRAGQTLDSSARTASRSTVGVCSCVC